MIARYISLSNNQYWVHVTGEGEDVERPFHVRYGPYPFGIIALWRLWVIARGTWKPDDEPALKMERVDQSIARQLSDSLQRNSKLVQRNVDLALENDKLRKRISELERS